MGCYPRKRRHTSPITGEPLFNSRMIDLSEEEEGKKDFNIAATTKKYLSRAAPMKMETGITGGEEEKEEEKEEEGWRG